MHSQNLSNRYLWLFVLLITTIILGFIVAPAGFEPTKDLSTPLAFKICSVLLLVCIYTWTIIVLVYTRRQIINSIGLSQKASKLIYIAILVVTTVLFFNPVTINFVLQYRPLAL